MANGDDSGNGNGNGNGNGVADSPQFEHKRLILAGVITFLWIALGVLGLFFKTHFYDLSIYFISLTGFAGAYIISETKRPSVSSTLFRKGRNSKREAVIYVMVALWLALGVTCIVMALDLLEAAAYFSALTPYISTYLLGSAYKPDLPKSAREMMYGNNMYGGFSYGYGYGNFNQSPLIQSGVSGNVVGGSPAGQQNQSVGQVQNVVSQPKPEDP